MSAADVINAGGSAGQFIFAPTIAILIYLAAPKEPWTFYIFAAALGAT